MANAIINILECNNSRIRLVVTQGDNPLSRVTIFTNGVERGFWTAPPLNNEKSYNWQPNHFNDGLNEVRVNARDNQGNVVSEFRYIIKGLDESSSLLNIIDENVRIKDDISTCCANLKSKLIDAGASVENTDKLSDMIPKIESLTVRKYGAGYYRKVLNVNIPRASSSTNGNWVTNGTYTVNTKEKYVDVVKLFIQVRNGNTGGVGESYKCYGRILVNEQEVLSVYSLNYTYESVEKVITLRRGDVVKIQSRSGSDSWREVTAWVSFGYIDSSFAD